MSNYEIDRESKDVGSSPAQTVGERRRAALAEVDEAKFSVSWLENSKVAKSFPPPTLPFDARSS